MTPIDLRHFLHIMQEAKSYSVPDGNGGWTVYRLVPDADARAFLAAAGAHDRARQESTYVRG